jgi:hypothetical protein
MTLLSVTAILGFSPIYLKAGYAFGFSSSACFIFVSVWAAPTRKSELPLKQRDLNIWVGESHDIPQGNYLAINLNTEIKFKNFIIESIDAKVGSRPEKNPSFL